MRKGNVTIKALVLVLALSLIAILAYALDYPHNDINTIGCNSCHHIHGEDAEENLFPPEIEYHPQNIDDTRSNTLCWHCHNDAVAPYVRTHSYLTTSDKYGNWSIECRTCHNPHLQEQFRTYGQESYLYSGASTEIQIDQPEEGKSQLSATGAGWEDNAYQGLVVIPNINQGSYGYKIESNTGDTLIVEGLIDLTKVTVGDTLAVIYGKLIKSPVSTPNSGEREVRLFKGGVLNFADGDATYDGACEVCHTKTAHHRNNDDHPEEADHTHNVSVKCTNCHLHLDGFKGGMGGGAHITHVTEGYGPELECTDCHGAEDPPMLADGQDLANTTVCTSCHSGDGVGDAKGYFGEDPGTWVGTEGEASYCGSCHDTTPGNTENDGSGDNAPNIVGDNATYGFFVTGHGKTSGNYTKLSWQDNAAAGNPAANKQCGSCHDLTSPHFNNAAKRLKAGYENDENNTNCNNCHISVANPDPDYYTNSADFEASAHNATNPLTSNPMLCSDCHDVHGAAGSFTGMTKGDRQNLCYQCHTDGVLTNHALANNRPGGYVSADDIEEAFGKSTIHNLGAPFTLNNKTYSLECVSCHNIHLVNGKYWDAEQGNKTPVTRFPPDAPSHLEPWGDEAGEKMDNFAAQGSGTGGWYYKTAQGYSLGAAGLPYDQPAAYRPPKSGSAYESEFGGDLLPDYTTFCLDCHSYRMSAANPPVNWGQGIGCTDNSVDPPDQRVECGAQHGLGAAGKPWYVSDAGTGGNWGSSGNPDVLFDMNYVSRGRHNGHFMRWPYDSAERSAGINFVLSCTDCHEAHGSNRGGMVRERFNVNDNGDCGTGGDPNPNGENCSDGGNWNSFCNACHYYYGGQHAGMSCGNASCHEANSIHRIIHTVDSGAGTQLMLTAAGYESNFQRPDFTPDIDTVTGYLDSNILKVTFKDGVYANPGNTEPELSGGLDKEDFWLFDKNNDNPRDIIGITHNAGDSTATITMSKPLIEADMSTDTLAMKPASAWSWYVGGYNNPATGVIPAQSVSAGPWPVTISGCPSATSFQLNEPAGSTTATDETGLLIGTVGNPAFVFQGDEMYFHGDEAQGTYIDFLNNNTCLNSPRAVTVEARVKPTEVDRGVGDNTFNRIFERRRTMLVTILNTDYRGDDIPERAGKASIEVKYRVENVFAPGSRHTCPHPQWPEDPYVGNDVRMHQISSDIDRWPLYDNHWYQIKVVFNSDKGPNYGTPVDIYLDDQGTDGLNTPNPTPWDPTLNPDSEQWPGYVNATKTINESSSCKWGALPGDVINDRDDSAHIGANWNHNQPFEGQIDWVAWKPVADYSGVDDLPNFGDPPTGVTVTPGNGLVEISWDAMPEAISYNIYGADSPGVTRLAVGKILGATSPETINGLNNGTTYYFIVTAVYSEGESGPSEEKSATPVP